MINTIDLSHCEKEPIHILGHIQSHGALLVLNDSLTILQVSDNTTTLLGRHPDNLLNQSVTTLFDPSQLQPLTSALSSKTSLHFVNPLPLMITVQGQPVSFNGIVHRNPQQALILELEPSLDTGRDPQLSPLTSSLGQRHWHSHVAKTMIAQFQTISSLPNLLQTVAQEIRRLIGVTRVMIYQFDEQWNGCVVAEDRREDLIPYLNLHYPASDIPKQARELYLRNPLRLIVDVYSQPSQILPTLYSATGTPLDLSFSALRAVSPMHIEYLKNMGVTTSFSISLLREDKLWGLIAGHHDSPRFLNYEMRQLCELLGQVISVQLTLLSKNQEYEFALGLKAYQSELLDALSVHAEPFVDILRKHQSALLKAVNAQGAVIAFQNQLTLLGDTPTEAHLQALLNWLPTYTQETVFATNSLSSIYPPAHSYKDTACGLLVLSIADHSPDYILWCRPEVIETVEWGGDPNKPVSLDAQGQPVPLDGQGVRISPRKSFDSWKQIVSLKSYAWHPSEIETATNLSSIKHIAANEIAQEELKQARDAAEVANRAKSTFLANMSHELRTPLNAVLGFAQIFKQEKGLPKEHHEYIDIIYRNGDYLLTLINDILDLSKIEAEKIELYPTDFHLGQFLAEIVELFQMRTQQKEIAFVYEPLSSLPKGVHVDQKRLRQVIINLLGNAVKFTKKGGVCFKIGSEDPSSPYTLRFQIEDTGIGMTSEDLTQLFQPFKQVGDEQYRAQGTGLGLSITKKLVEMMGGQLHVNSQLGEGTTFWMVLPLKAATTDVDMKRETPPVIVGYERRPDQSPCKVLAVDDRKENRSLLVKLLTPLGFEVREAGNGKEAVELAREWIPNIVLTDLVMPVMDGFEATRQLRKMPELTELVIIMLSASAFDYHQSQSREVGCDDFLAKPFRSEVLLEKMQKHLHITWICEQSSDSQESMITASEETVPDGQPERGPSSEQAGQLLDLAMQGDLDGIVEYVQQLEQAEQTLAPFARKIWQLADDLKDQEICEIVKRYIH